MQIGPYEVLDEVGRGGMGAVFHARDSRLAREVALKVLLKDDDLSAAQRMLREAESLARLRHPNIVAVHGVEEFEGRQVLVMEWVAGESLQARLDREGPLSSVEVRALARALAEAVAAAHEQGVLHRDLKPANVLLGHDGRVRLTDFGLAWELGDRAERLSKSGQLLGSPGYWSPEQAKGARQELGPHTDVWGLGATLYACLTGVAPLRGQTMAELVVAATYQTVRAPSELTPGVDPDLERVVLRCLEKAPQDRYRSAAALVADLERRSRAADPEARSWAPALAVAAVLLAGAGGAVAGLRRAPPEAEPTPSASVAAADPADPTPAASPSPVDGDEASTWVVRANQRADRGELHRAIDACDRALAIDPEDVPALVLRGYLKTKLGRKREGRVDCERAVALAPTSAEAQHVFARVLVASGAEAEALERLRVALRHTPKHVPSLELRGQLLFKAGRLDEARALLERAAALEPKRFSVQLSLGQLAAREQRFTDAEGHFDVALESQPRDFASLVGRAIARRVRGQDLLGALADLNVALEVERGDPAAWFQRGLVRADLGDHRGAVEDHSKALQLRADLPTVWVARGFSWLERKHPERALSDAKEALKLDPELVEAYALRGDVYRRSGRALEAGRALGAGLSRQPNNATVRVVRARLYLDLGRFSASEHDCSVVLHKTPNHLDALRWRAEARKALGRRAEALADLEAFLKLAPAHDPDRAAVEALRRALKP